MADQEKGGVQTRDISDAAALETKVEEVRDEQMQPHDLHVTGLCHVYGHLQSYTNQGGSSNTPTVEEVSVDDSKRDDSSGISVLEVGMGELKVDSITIKKKARPKRAKAQKKAKTQQTRGQKMAKPELTEAEKEEMDRVVKMVLDHFKTFYARDDLASWQAISRDLGVKIGVTIAECKQILEGIFINIIDFVEACRQNKLPHYFDTGRSLADYIRSNHPKKTFPLEVAKEVPILKWMLIDVAQARRLHRG